MGPAGASVRGTENGRDDSMKIKELKKQLDGFDEDTEVVLFVYDGRSDREKAQDNLGFLAKIDDDLWPFGSSVKIIGKA
jgi:hypothetical protein